MDSDEPFLPISSNSPIPIVLITITRYTVTIPRFPRRYVGRKSEQHKRKQHEDNRRNIIQSYQNHIYIQEKSKNTIDKYIRDIRTFTAWLETQEQKDITKKVHIKMQKLNVNMLALVFLFKDIEKMSRKLYNNRDKKRRALLWQMEYISK